MLHKVIENFTINQLQFKLNLPLRMHKIRYPDVKLYQYPDYDCNHGSLQFLGKFRNLKEISLQFGKNDLGTEFERRFFQVSDLDIKLLSK